MHFKKSANYLKIAEDPINGIQPLYFIYSRTKYTQV